MRNELVLVFFKYQGQIVGDLQTVHVLVLVNKNYWKIIIALPVLVVWINKCLKCRCYISNLLNFCSVSAVSLTSARS